MFSYDQCILGNVVGSRRSPAEVFEIGVLLSIEIQRL
jgi:hypothetical protein